MKASGPERAILEVLSDISEEEASFAFAAELFEGLTTNKQTPVKNHSLIHDVTTLRFHEKSYISGKYRK